MQAIVNPSFHDALELERGSVAEVGVGPASADRGQPATLLAELCEGWIVEKTPS